jgi:HlyD family secretion protein
MDPNTLKALEIKPEAKSRSQSSIVFIFLAVVIITGTCAYFAWPRAEDSRRLAGGKKENAAAANTASGTALSSSDAAARSGSVEKSGGILLTVSGYIVNRERIELSPRFMGVVKWIGVKKGDSVTNGQVVVLLDDAEQRARLLEAEGKLANTKVGLAKAELDYKRMQKLIAQHVETQQTEDDLRLRVESAKASIKEIEGVVELARTYLDWTVIRSPINGVILEKLVDPNELVTPQSFGGTRGPSTALIALADPKDLQVEVDLNESDLAKVSLGQKCNVSPEAYPDKIYEGKVAERAPEANRQKGTLQVKVQILNPDEFLTPELSAKVEFLSQTNSIKGNLTRSN